VLLQLTCC